jgi:hypothetical protein
LAKKVLIEMGVFATLKKKDPYLELPQKDAIHAEQASKKSTF